MGIPEPDKIKDNEMNDIFLKEYLRHTKMIMRSKLTGRNKIMASYTWSVSLMTYGAGKLGWNTHELQSLTEKQYKS